MTILIQNGQVINPATGMNEVADVLVENGVVSKIEKGIKEKADRKINAKGCFVMPGFIDMHVHLRDPGFEEKETIETGCRAAAHGGYTTILAMPNTKPVVDNPDVVNSFFKASNSSFADTRSCVAKIKLLMESPNEKPSFVSSCFVHSRVAITRCLVSSK